MAKRPTPHVDTSAAEALPDGWSPTATPASNATQHLTVGLYGDNGTGKTHGLGTFPKPIVVALDPGYSTLAKFPNADDIMVVRVPDPSDPDTPPLKQLWRIIQWAKQGNHDRLTFGLDSVTELHKMILEAVMQKPRQRPAPNVPDTDDYIEANAKLTNVIRHLRDLPMHVVLTGHHKVLKKKDDVLGIRFDLSEKLSTAIGGACDVVLHCTVHERQNEDTGERQIAYVGQTVPMDNVQAKDRSGNMRQPFSKFDWPTIAKAFNVPTDGVQEDDTPEPPAEPMPDTPTPDDAADTPDVAPCDTCGGDGADPEVMGEDCRSCHGSGLA